MDFLFLTETWLSPDFPPSIPNSLTPTGYSFLQVPRLSGRGGGLAVIFRSAYSLTSVNSATFLSFEHMLLRLTCATKSYLFLIVYRPPSCSKAAFLSDFALLLEDLATSPSEFVAMGDFNIHLDDPVDTYSTSLKTLLETFDLKQHISSPTHTSGHILDLLITKSTSSISSPGLTEFFLSDHKAVNFQISTTVIHSTCRTKKAHFIASFCQQFESVILTLLDKPAPEKPIICRGHVTK